MDTKEIKTLLKRYFNGESTKEEEKILEGYFSFGDVADELKEYSGFFGGLAELSAYEPEGNIEDDVMDFILEQEYREKKKYRELWRTVTAIAASIIIILGGVLIYEQQKQPFKDTYSDPAEAYLQAKKTLEYISAKYNIGVDQLSNAVIFNEAIEQLDKVDILRKAPAPLQEGVKTINKGFNEFDLEKYSQLTKNE